MERVLYAVEGVSEWIDRRIYKRRGDLTQSMNYQLGNVDKKKIKVKAYRLQEIDNCTLAEFKNNKEYVYTFYVQGELYSFKSRGYEGAVNKLFEELTKAGKKYTLAMSTSDATHIVFSNGESIPLHAIRHVKVEV